MIGCVKDLYLEKFVFDYLLSIFSVCRVVFSSKKQFRKNLRNESCIIDTIFQGYYNYGRQRFPFRNLIMLLNFIITITVTWLSQKFFAKCKFSKYTFINKMYIIVTIWRCKTVGVYKVLLR